MNEPQLIKLPNFVKIFSLDLKVRDFDFSVRKVRCRFAYVKVRTSQLWSEVSYKEPKMIQQPKSNRNVGKLFDIYNSE